MILTLSNDRIELVLDTIGGGINSIFDIKKNKEHVWKYDERIWNRRTNLCFPFCGAVNKGIFEVEGKRYQAQMHGFLRTRDLKVLSKDKESAVLYDEFDGETLKLYPYKYRIEICYSLFLNGVNIQYRIINLDNSDMCYSFGTHYTYEIDDKNTDSILFSNPETASEYDAITGQTKNQLILDNCSVLKLDGLFENGSIKFKRSQLNSSFFGLGKGECKYTTVVPSGFKFVMFWAPKGKNTPFVSIENWDGMADGENDSIILGEKRHIRTLEGHHHRDYYESIFVD